MKMHLIGAIALIAGTSIASGQAVTGFSGGSTFGGWGAGPVGDTIGWRFDVNTDIFVTDLGVWNQDTVFGFEGLSSDHMVGIWDAAGTLMASVNVTPGGTAVGDWTYASISQITLLAGNRYTIGAHYLIDDNDAYVSGPSSISLAPEISNTNGVFPTVQDLGFAFPDGDSTNLGRFGPNFLFTPVPTPASAALLGLGGLVATRRRR